MKKILNKVLKFIPFFLKKNQGKISSKKNRIFKIAIVTDAIYPYNKGGKEKRIYELSTRLAKKDFKITIYCMKWWKDKKNHKIENGVHIHAISPFYPLYSGQRRSIKQAFMFSIFCFKLLFEEFDIIDADHMPHLVLFPLKFICILKRKKFIATWNEVWGRRYWKQYLGLFGNIAFLIEYLSAHLPDEIIAISPHTKKRLSKILHFRKPIHLIPCGINLKEINKIKPSKQKSDIIYAGRLLSHKNIDILIQTVYILKDTYPNLKAFIIGNGPEESKLKYKTKNLGLENNIIFYDFLENHKDLYALMKSSKTFVFPSTREGFGIVTLEANACNLPVITTNHADNAAKTLIIEGKNGRIVSANPHEFAHATSVYLQKKYEKQHNQINDFDWNKITKQIKDVYNI